MDDQVDLLQRRVDNKLVVIDEELEMFRKEFARMKKTIENTYESGCGEDWIPYSDSKCYKLLGIKGTELEAKGNCTLLDSSSTLITIHSEDEQIFLSNLLKDYKNISVNVWIGLKFIDEAFQWTDGNEFKFENWGENAIKDGNSKCVHMSLADFNLGKWTDDMCQKRYQIVCQKEKSNKFVETIIDTLIPLGFIYTELPHQSSPQKLWPKMEWTEVTEEYAGLFFRAEGGGSDPFGTVQNANYSRLSDVHAESCKVHGWHNCVKNSYPTQEGNWTQNLVHEGFNDRLYLYFTTGENRPRNTAIKIWKRIK